MSLHLESPMKDGTLDSRLSNSTLGQWGRQSLPRELKPKPNPNGIKNQDMAEAIGNVFHSGSENLGSRDSHLGEL